MKISFVLFFSLLLQVLMEEWLGDAPGMMASNIICGHFSACQIKDALTWADVRDLLSAFLKGC